MSVRDSTEAAIAAANHLTAMDDGAIAVLLVLAEKIDDGTVPSDSVTIPTYLRCCAALGLTPAGRKRLDERKEPQGGKLAQLRSVNTAGKPKRGHAS